MLQTIMQGWLSIWLYVMAAIAIALGVNIYKNRKKWDKLTILCTAAIIVLVLHVIEEWAIPGGLHYSYNITNGGTSLGSYPMNRMTDMITNFGGVLLGCIILKFWGFKKPTAIAIMLFSLMEFVMHIGIGIQDMGRFGQYGMNIMYSPGLITALFGFLPIAIGIAIELYKPANKSRPSLKQWILAIAGTMVFAFLLISLPETMLKYDGADSPYQFTDRGYYEQFGEQYEEDNGYTYFDSENSTEEGEEE